MKTRSALFSAAGLTEEIDVSLDAAGIRRLVEQTHADVNKIRAERGLPPHDFSKGPKLSRQGRRSLQVATKPKTVPPKRGYIWQARNYCSTSNPTLPKSKRKAANA